MAVVGAIVVLIALLIFGLVSKGGGSSSDSTAGSNPTKSSKNSAKAHKGKHRNGSASSSKSALVAVSLHPTAPVYVCLIADNGRKAIAGVELKPGDRTPTYHARKFELTLGNSSVRMFVDGHERPVPSSSQAIGYSITKANGRKRLALGNLPTCK